MPDLQKILNEVSAAGSGADVVRRKYLAALAEKTGRNVIVYYSGWLQKAGVQGVEPHIIVNDSDKNGFMATVHQLPRDKGLDLILHTPGGDIAATESLVHYIRQMFGTNVRAIVPQLAMSAGTMIALSCKEVVLGKHSNLGPIDPQVGIFPAHGVIEEFNRAAQEIGEAPDLKQQQAKAAIWQPIIAKYNPTLIGQCQKAISWSETMVTDWLRTGMFEGDERADEKAKKVADGLGSHALTKSHARHIHLERLVELGVKITALEDDQELQDAVLTVHHACIHTLAHTAVVKLIENHLGVGFILAMQITQPK